MAELLLIFQKKNIYQLNVTLIKPEFHVKKQKNVAGFTNKLLFATM
jgi:hypothetical protein